MSTSKAFIEATHLSDEALLHQFFGEEAALMLESYGTLENVVQQAVPQYSLSNQKLHAAIELVKRINLARAAERVRMTDLDTVAAYLTAHVVNLEHEVFIAMWLDASLAVIGCEELFRGTLTHTSVYPREVVKRALQVNACAVIVAHNHPSNSATPSDADKSITTILVESLALVDVKLLDHFVLARSTFTSFAQTGLLPQAKSSKRRRS
jgi:DNA repair protein RadC